MKRIVTCVAVAGLVAVTGCSNAQKVGAVGMVAGAATGGIWAATAGILSAGEGAMVGAATGGLGGMAIGDAIDQQESKAAELAHKKALDNMEHQLAAQTKRLGELEKELAQGSATPAVAPPDQSARIGELTRERNKAAAKAHELEAALGEMKRRLAKSDQQLAQAQKLLDDRNALLTSRDKTLSKNRKALTDQNEEIRRLQKDLGDAIKVQRQGRKITLTFANEILFDSGKAKIRPDGQTLLAKTAKVIAASYGGHELSVEGHTDNVPIQYSGYPSNWELSASRAFSVLHHLVGKQGFEASRISATAYGQTRPVADNVTEEGRRANRRAVIVIFPKDVSFQRRPLSVAALSGKGVRK